MSEIRKAVCTYVQHQTIKLFRKTETKGNGILKIIKLKVNNLKQNKPLDDFKFAVLTISKFGARIFTQFVTANWE